MKLLNSVNRSIEHALIIATEAAKPLNQLKYGYQYEEPTRIDEQHVTQWASRIIDESSERSVHARYVMAAYSAGDLSLREAAVRLEYPLAEDTC